jgi:hypothetical protein
VIHPAGIVFKGTGWYLTDSRPTTETSGGVQDATKVAEKKADMPADTGNPPAASTATASAAATATKEA